MCFRGPLFISKYAIIQKKDKLEGYKKFWIKIVGYPKGFEMHELQECLENYPVVMKNMSHPGLLDEQFLSLFLINSVILS